MTATSYILAQLEALQAEEYENEKKSIQLLHVQDSRDELEDLDSGSSSPKLVPQGGGICSRIIFFLLLTGLVLLTVLIFFEARSAREVDLPLEASRFSAIFDGLVEDHMEQPEEAPAYDTEEPVAEQDFRADLFPPSDQIEPSSTMDKLTVPVVDWASSAETTGIVQPEAATHTDEPVIETEAIHASASAALGDMSTPSSEEPTPDAAIFRIAAGLLGMIALHILLVILGFARQEVTRHHAIPVIHVHEPPMESEVEPQMATTVTIDHHKEEEQVQEEDKESVVPAMEYGEWGPGTSFYEEASLEVMDEMHHYSMSGAPSLNGEKVTFHMEGAKKQTVFNDETTPEMEEHSRDDEDVSDVTEETQEQELVNPVTEKTWEMPEYSLSPEEQIEVFEESPEGYKSEHLTGELPPLEREHDKSSESNEIKLDSEQELGDLEVPPMGTEPHDAQYQTDVELELDGVHTHGLAEEEPDQESAEQEQPYPGFQDSRQEREGSEPHLQQVHQGRGGLPTYETEESLQSLEERGPYEVEESLQSLQEREPYEAGGESMENLAEEISGPHEEETLTIPSDVEMREDDMEFHEAEKELLDAEQTLHAIEIPKEQPSSEESSHVEAEENFPSDSHNVHGPDDANFKEPEETSHSAYMPDWDEESEEAEQRVEELAPLSNPFPTQIKHSVAQLRETIQDFSTILDVNPKSHGALYGYAHALDRLAQLLSSNDVLDDALDAFRKLLSLPHRQVPAKLYKKALRRFVERLQFRGHLQGAVEVLEAAVRDFPDEKEWRNSLAVGYLLLGENDLAKEALEDTLELWPEDGFAKVHLGFIYKVIIHNYAKGAELMEEGINTNEEGTHDGRFYYHLGDAYIRLKKQAQADAIHEKGAKEGIFLSTQQRSLYNVDHLKAQPWWTNRETTYEKDLEAMEERWEQIMEEVNPLIRSGAKEFSDESEDLRDGGSWKELILFARGRRHSQNCNLVPRTCGILEAFPAASQCRRGQVKFSLMQPRTHVWPHTGPTNCRLRAHLGLEGLQGAAIRVANETRTWKLGKFIIFDDSFEHEVWHNGTTDRLVLIVDMWHPGLNEQERHTLPAI
ncbi:unnamed protein product [Darwinula stevensoni]|uniref:Aspartyl/asparaginy/proline hydroxylase domain-containing protein n=1 Tax=Darwinula stevensoni TaxID=69355 RepID=A0A7R8X8L2_9CRUS|nr:unnamed protein product [Darwinula stevensoni]CAG0883536.1 unnamed protein product [Darwinula stevensoni]